MTRAEAKQFLIDNLGIEEPTEENVTNYLNSLNNAVGKAKTDSDKAKADASKVKELQAKLDAIEEENLSEVERVNKDLAKALEDVANLKRDKAIADKKANLMTELKISQEEVDKLVDDEGNVNISELGILVSGKEKSAADAKEKELADGSKGPSGGTGGSEEKSSAEKWVETLVPKTDGNTDSVISSYL